MEIANKELIVVLGMHRSGTSAFTSGLQVMGVSLGGNLIPAIEGNNAKGFWEDADINAFNNELLHFVGSDWHYLVPIGSQQIELLNKAGYLQRAAALLRAKMQDIPLFAFKDPRVAKLLPFWKLVFSHCQLNVRYVLVVRHPLSVAKSLLKRDDFVIQKSYLLWLEYVITSLAGTLGEKRVLVDYDRLMQSPAHELQRVATFLGLEIDLIAMQSYEKEFLDPGLRHSTYKLSELLLDNACPPLVHEIYAVLLDIATGKTEMDGAALKIQVAKWANEYNQLNSQSLLSLADGLSSGIAERDRVIAERDRVIAERDRVIAERDRVIAERDALINAIYASHSWRVTRPLRYLSQLISRS